MAVTESDLDPKLRKTSISFWNCAENKLGMRYSSWNATDSKNTIFDLIIQGEVLDIG